MFRKLTTKRKYPWTGDIRGKKYTFRPMTVEDRDSTIAFTANLPHSDILFLQSDITKPEIIDEWLYAVENNRAFVLLAFNSANEIVGYASLYHNENSWMRHQIEIRMFVVRDHRNTGVGKHLAGEIAAIAEEQNPEIITANIPREHPHIRMMLEKKGFNVEALLTDWLMDTDGKTHDLLVMARRLKDDLT